VAARVASCSRRWLGESFAQALSRRSRRGVCHGAGATGPVPAVAVCQVKLIPSKLSFVHHRRLAGTVVEEKV
jgi:hypothetical protein